MGWSPSRSAARRAIAEGGAYLNNARLSDPDARLVDEDLLYGRYVITRRGKRTVGAVSLDRVASRVSAVTAWTDLTPANRTRNVL